MFEGLLQPTHLLIILVIILIVFGAGKLPEVGGGLGKSIKEFRNGVRDASASDDPVTEAPKSISDAKPAQSSSNVCASCGASLPPDARFCGSCGAKQAA